MHSRQWKVYVLPRFRHKYEHSPEREGEVNKRKLGSFVLCAMLFALCLPADAQQPKKVSRIGHLTPDYVPDISSRISALIRQGLRELGNVEGKNIVIEYRHADNKLDRLPALADELVRL